MNIEEIKLKRKELLDETASHFNSTNRSVEKGVSISVCIYSGVGCAIGRKIEDKELCKKLDWQIESAVSSDNTFQMLPENLKELGQDFLTELQNLHDAKGNWIESGLSDEGYQKYYKIIKEFCV